MTLTIREATIDDLSAIVALLADDQLGASREDLSGKMAQEYLDAFAAIDTDPNQTLVVAEQDGAVVGTFQLSYLPGLSHSGSWRGQIEAVRISRELRGQGLGARMMVWAVEQCRTRGCRIVQLTSNASRDDAHRFYERLGFEKSHAGFKLTL